VNDEQREMGIRRLDIGELICSGKTIREAIAERIAGERSLYNADLRGADLMYANLRYVDLRGADLRDTDLRYANLRDTDLRGADLRGADLRYVDLRYVDLRDTDLRDTDLRDANLRDTDLRDANLRDTDLRGADLRDADLRDADLERPHQTIACPTHGSFIGWKKCRDEVIVKLQIPARAKRSNSTTNKCRAEYVKVLGIFGAETGISRHDGETTYVKGETVHCDDWCDDWRIECGGGIHFFISREAAEEY